MLIALALGLAALFAFLWSMKSGQFDDMEGNASRILFDDDDEQVPTTEKKEDAKTED